MWEWHHSQYLGGAQSVTGRSTGTHVLIGAHGVSGILYILLQVPGILEDAETRKLIIGVLEYLLTLKGEDGNYPTRGKSHLRVPNPSISPVSRLN